MAYLILNNGKKSMIPEAKALDIWAKINDPADLDDKQIQFLQTIRGLFLNWRKAPDSYIAAHLPAIIPCALSTWQVNRAGKPSRPGNDASFAFAVKHGLWAFNNPTPLAKEYI